jgi:hypothetical protein
MCGCESVCTECVGETDEDFWYRHYFHTTHTSTLLILPHYTNVLQLLQGPPPCCS